MRRRTRKFIGIFACIVFVAVYCLIAMAIGGDYVVGAPPAIEAAYFILAGTAWLPPIMLLIRWMSRPDN